MADRGKEPANCGEVECIKETAKAILVRFKDNDGQEMWIPKSVIHDDSEVYDVDEHDTGDLILQTWFAEKEELI